MPEAIRKKLGQILLDTGAIDEDQLRVGLAHREQWGMPIGRALVERGFCSSADVLHALSLQSGHLTINLATQALDHRLVAVLPAKAAERLRAVPIRLEGARSEVLVVAMAGPASMEAIDEVRSVTRKSRVLVRLADDDAIEYAIGQLYHGHEPPRPVMKPTPLSLPMVSGEAEFDLGEEPERPVLLFGWRDVVAKALLGVLRNNGILAEVVDEDRVLDAQSQDLVVCGTSSLEMLLPTGSRLPAQVIISGMPQDEDVDQAKAIGARLYLRSPLNADQLVKAIQRCRAQLR